MITRILKTEQDSVVQQHPVLQFLWGKLGYETSHYKELLELYQEGKTTIHAHPFVIYSLHRSGRMDEALRLSEEIVSNIRKSYSDHLEFIDALTLYEGLLAGAQAAAYGERLSELMTYLKEAEEILNALILDKFPTALEIASDLELALRVGQLFGNIFIGQLQGSVQIIEHVLEQVLPTANNDFLIANFWNLAGNTHVSIRRLDKGRECFRQAIRYATKCGDLRIEAVAKANLSNILVIEAQTDEAIEVTREALDTFEKLGDQHNQIIMIIVLGMLYVSQSNLPAAESQAQRLLDIFKSRQVSPDSCLLGSMLLAMVHRFSEARYYLQQVKEMIEDAKNPRLELELKIVEGVIESEQGNLALAHQIFEQALDMSDRYQLYNLSLDILINRVINALKYYLTIDDDRFLVNVWSLFEELRLLLSDFDLPSILILRNLIAGNLLVARFHLSEAKLQLQQAKEMLSECESTKLLSECEKTLQKMEWLENFLKNLDTTADDDIVSLLFEDAKMIQHYFARETLRLLLDLSVSKFEISSVGHVRPILLMLITSGGLAIYTHDFQGTQIDEQMISSFLTAIASFSQNIFGSGMLRTIQHENYFILLESITTELYLALISEKESYDMRNKMKQFIAILKEKTGILEQISLKPAITMDDQEFSILEHLCKEIFEEKKKKQKLKHES